MTLMTMNPPTHTDFPTGCLIDASHLPADYLNARVILLAERAGYDAPAKRRDEDEHEYLSEVADEALSWLNDFMDRADDERRFYFEDNSLYLAFVDTWGESLGSCGCTDYHMSDCPTRSSYTPDYDALGEHYF